jgi:hypothetical protein
MYRDCLDWAPTPKGGDRAFHFRSLSSIGGDGLANG